MICVLCKILCGGNFVFYSTNKFSDIKENSEGNDTLVLLHSDIVNGSQLLCDAHTVLEQHSETAALFSPFLLFLFWLLFKLFCGE